MNLKLYLTVVKKGTYLNYVWMIKAVLGKRRCIYCSERGNPFEPHVLLRHFLHIRFAMPLCTAARCCRPVSQSRVVRNQFHTKRTNSLLPRRRCLVCKSAPNFKRSDNHSSSDYVHHSKNLRCKTSRVYSTTISGKRLTIFCLLFSKLILLTLICRATTFD